MSLIEKQQNLAQMVLNDLATKQIIQFNGLIAGGAPRNWDFGMPANDIDIFASIHENLLEDFKDKKDFQLKLEAKIKEIFPTVDKVEFLGNADNKSEYKRFTCEFVLEDVKFQVIIDDSVMESILGFDFGLNKIWMNFDGDIVKYYQYNIDKEEEKLTFYPDLVYKNNTYKKLAARKNKMKSMFPNFALDVCEMTEQQLADAQNIIKEHGNQAEIRRKSFMQTDGVDDEELDDEIYLINSQGFAYSKSLISGGGGIPPGKLSSFMAKYTP
jgi:hypothetical protein